MRRCGGESGGVHRRARHGRGTWAMARGTLLLLVEGSRVKNFDMTSVKLAYFLIGLMLGSW